MLLLYFLFHLIVCLNLFNNLMAILFILFYFILKNVIGYNLILYINLVLVKTVIKIINKTQKYNIEAIFKGIMALYFAYYTINILFSYDLLINFVLWILTEVFLCILIHFSF